MLEIPAQKNLQQQYVFKSLWHHYYGSDSIFPPSCHHSQKYIDYLRILCVVLQRLKDGSALWTSRKNSLKGYVSNSLKGYVSRGMSQTPTPIHFAIHLRGAHDKFSPWGIKLLWQVALLQFSQQSQSISTYVRSVSSHTHSTKLFLHHWFRRIVVGPGHPCSLFLSYVLKLHYMLAFIPSLFFLTMKFLLF